MKKKNQEIPIGGIGIINGYKVMAKEYTFENSCDDCCFGHSLSLSAGYPHGCPFKKCIARLRTDKKHVYFVIAEKGGEK